MKKTSITIIGLGYVGLPLAVEFAKKFQVTGFDINKKRIEQLKQGDDVTLEISKTDLLNVLKNSNDEGKVFLLHQSLKILQAQIFIL